MATITCKVDQVALAHFRAECRFISVLLGLTMMLNMIEPALLISEAPGTMLARIAGMTHHPDWLALFFMQCAAMLIPHVWTQAFHPHGRAHRWATKLATFSLCMSSALWLLLAYLSRNVDAYAVTVVFVRNSGLAVTFAFALAIALNNEQLRGLQKHET